MCAEACSAGPKWLVKEARPSVDSGIGRKKQERNGEWQKQGKKMGKIKQEIHTDTCYHLNAEVLLIFIAVGL